jgi:tetratricopeptide (TPR) repeat protein
VTRSVFLSSTSRDLTEYRQVVIEAINGLDDYKCVAMEDFGARDWAADDFCRAKVAECDLFVGIVGHLYGSCPEGCAQSYTEREYDAAIAAERPRLMFIAPEDLPFPGNLRETDEKWQKQRAFRQRVSQARIRDTFTSPDDLARRVVAAIRNWEQEQAAQERRPRAARAEEVLPLPPQPYFAHPYPLQANFTGRVTERQTLTAWLAGDGCPVLAVIALGGMGKSALTWAWLQRDVLGLPLPGETPDVRAMETDCRVDEAARPEGVVWWSFYERESRFAKFLDEALTYASGGQVDPAGMPSTHDKVQALLVLLQRRRVLLVLDGFERALRAYASLSAAYQGDEVAQTKDARGDYRACVDPHAGLFLQWAASLRLCGRVLLTSRLLPRELDGLPGCHHEELTALAPDDAVAFLRAQGITKGTRAEIQAACEPYGYHPLALRLLAGVIARDKRTPGDVRAAKRTPVLPRLKGKGQHHILQVAYDTLEKRKQALLSRFAAFRSPMDYDALLALNPFKDEAPFDAALDELIERGLLLFDAEHARYDLHPVVRRYAYERLGDKASVHTQLRDYFAAVPQPEHIESLDDLAPTIELYHHTVRAGQYDEARRWLRDRLIPNPLYFRFGAYQLCIELLRALFPGGEPLAPSGEAALPLLNKESDQAWTLNELANAYALSGQPGRAVPLFEAHNTLREKADDKKNLATGLENLADDQLKIGALAAAAAALRRSIALCREIGDERIEAIGHWELGRLLAYTGAFEEAETELEVARGVFDNLGVINTNLVSVVRTYKALLFLQRENPDLALVEAKQALELAQHEKRSVFGGERDIIRAEWLLGAAHRARGELAQAEPHLDEALRRCRRINMVDHEPDILLELARLRHDQAGLPSPVGESLSLAREALAIADSCEYRLVQADCHNFLARLTLEAGNLLEARQHAEIAREHAACDGPGHRYEVAFQKAERLLEEIEARARPR